MNVLLWLVRAWDWLMEPWSPAMVVATSVFVIVASVVLAAYDWTCRPIAMGLWEVRCR